MLADAELTDAEGRLVETAGIEEPLVLDERQVVRAEVVVDLVTGRRTPPSGLLREVAVATATIVGRLDLGAITVPCPLVFVDCVFEEPVVLVEARTVSLRFRACELPRLEASYLRADGAVDLAGSTSTGGVYLDAAQVTGELCLARTTLHDPGGEFALYAEGLVVEQNVYAPGLHAVGGVDLINAQVGSLLNLGGARLVDPDGIALHADWLVVGRSLLCRGGFLAEGEVRLGGASVEGDVSFTEAMLRNEGGDALWADGMTVGGDLDGTDLGAVGRVLLARAHVDGSLLLNGAHLSYGGGYALQAFLLEVDQDLTGSRGFVADGGVNLDTARIGGDLELRGARLFGGRIRSPEGDIDLGTALSGYGLQVARATNCGPDFRARGRLDFRSASLGDGLWLDGAELHNPGGDAVQASGLTTVDVFGREQVADGDVVLTGANVTGEVDLRAATLRSPGRDALAGRAMTVGGDLRCYDGFTADGRFRLRDARVAGRLDLGGATLTDGGADHVVDLEGVQAHLLDLRFARPPSGVLELSGAHVQRLEDDPETWPQRLMLRGFSYELAAASGIPVDWRLDWLRRHRDGVYEPGPYDMLAAAYRRAGHVERARRVAVAKLVHRRSKLRVPGKLWNWFLFLTVGYGYHPVRAGLWLLGLLGGGWLAFALAERTGSFRPTATEVPGFHPLLYTIDVLLPVGDLGQQSGWVADGAASVVVVLLVLGGWLLAAAVVAGLTNTLRRD